jgi:tRNA threonylcarbamoyladenosine modification (KEOPS) complex Cgi121 subunit
MKMLRVRAPMGAEAAHKALERYDAVAIRPEAVASTEELELALHLAQESFRRKKNIAKRMKYEFLLWVSGKTDIRSAMKESAPSGDEFLVVVISGTEGRAVLGALGAEEMPLGLKEEGEPLALERISLSRIK